MRVLARAMAQVLKKAESLHRPHGICIIDLLVEVEGGVELNKEAVPSWGGVFGRGACAFPTRAFLSNSLKLLRIAIRSWRKAILTPRGMARVGCKYTLLGGFCLFFGHTPRNRPERDWAMSLGPPGASWGPQETPGNR